jgi:hypothetical protein
VPDPFEVSLINIITFPKRVHVLLFLIKIGA